MDNLIKREDAIKALKEADPFLLEYDGCEEVIRAIPSAEPWDIYNFDEWCTDCKEYDTENHRCPRWNKVIRRTLEENQSKQGWIPCSERLPEEDICDSYLIAWIPANEKVKCGLPHYYQVADWEDGDWTNLDFCGHEVIVILAWMPLPEPYIE